MKNEVGKRYGNLVVVALDHIDEKHNARFLCKCDCGCTTVVKGNMLRNGRTKSCGCLKRYYQETFGSRNTEYSSERMKVFNKTAEHREQARIAATTHGCSKERLYRVWSHMKERCNATRGYHAKWYHDKGIRVCDEWLDYMTFREWAYSNGYFEPSKNMDFKDYPSIDRIDPEKGYSPDNCRWITVSENSILRNKYYADQR